MESLPVELRQAILQRMDLPTLKAMRLAAKSWASLGEEYLMPLVFRTLPHRDDITRFLAIAKHPKFSYRIQSLFINLGEINEYHARHNTYFLQYMRTSDERSDSLEAAWSDYAQIKLLKERYIGTFCELPPLKEAFSGLPNLRAIQVSLMTSPFDSPSSPELFRNIWRIPSTRLLPRVATTERFTNILTAITSSSSVINIQTLSHDRLPFEFFAQKPLLISLLSTAFHTLSSLSLTLDYSEMPNDLHFRQAFENLSHCLRCAANLKSLQLAFQGRKKISISPLFSRFDDHQFSFGELGSLKIEGVTSTELELGGFMSKQKVLRCVQLGGAGLRSLHQPANGGVHLREGSFRGLFNRVEKDMKLERFEIMGDLVGLESGERWILDSIEEVGNLREYVID